MKRIILGKYILCMCILSVLGCMVVEPKVLYGQEDKQLADLNKQVLEGKDMVEESRLLEEIRAVYIASNRYNAWVAYLSEIMPKKKQLEPLLAFHIAQARYAQLKFLEENQLWDEYFSQGNTYRMEITDNLGKVFAATPAHDPVNLKARLISWQFHRDQQDVFHEDALVDLMEGARTLGRESQGTAVLKDVADVLLAYGEKAKSKELYKVYVEKMVQGAIKDEALEQAAAALFEKGNLELAQLIYDVYITRITASMKEESLPKLFEIARKFGIKSTRPEKDLLYAEKVYSVIEEIGKKEIFDEELLYERALNLEKAKEYSKAKEYYLQLLERFPETSRRYEARFKIGMIEVYFSRDLPEGRKAFEAAAASEPVNAHVIAGIYQLGLLSHWENDLEKARTYYNQLIEKAANEYEDTVNLAKERLKEIEEAKPLEYNLKTFLDISLSPHETQYDMTKVALRSSSFLVKKDEETNVLSNGYTPETGCMQVSLQYLWSGHTGVTKPTLDEASFDTFFKQAGTKEVNVVLVSPTGIIDRDFIMIDVN